MINIIKYICLRYRSEFIHSPKGVRSFTQIYQQSLILISLPSLERIKLRIQPKGFTQTLDHDCYMIGSLNVLDIVCYIQEAYRDKSTVRQAHSSHRSFA